MEKKESLTGRCICGQVKYRITEKPFFTQACHCKDCKIITGSAYVINTSVLDNTLIIEGDISSTELKTGSGATSSCLLYTSPSPRDMRRSRMPSSA